jgi:NADH-quinone oxidoreductase subunit L
MGNLKKYMPVTWITMLIGTLAIAGIPIFAGFFSKDEILYKTFAADKYFPNGPFPGNEILWVVAVATALLTAVYMTRMMVMTFWGEERFHLALPEGEHPHEDENAIAGAGATEDEAHHDAHGHDAGHDDDEDDHHHALPQDFKPHESPWSMTMPLIVLAFLSTVGGLVGVPYAMSSLVGIHDDVNVFEHTLEPVIYKRAEQSSADKAPTMSAPHSPASSAAKPAPAAAKQPETKTHDAATIAKERWLALGSVVVAIFGIGIGWVVFRRDPLRKMPKILEDKWRLDELYNGYIVDPLTKFSTNGLWKGFDVGLIDGIVNGAGHFVAELGGVVRRLQVGFVRSYAAFILLGGLVVIGYFIYFGLKLIR